MVTPLPLLPPPSTPLVVNPLEEEEVNIAADPLEEVNGDPFITIIASSYSRCYRSVGGRGRSPYCYILSKEEEEVKSTILEEEEVDGGGDGGERR